MAFVTIIMIVMNVIKGGTWSYQQSTCVAVVVQLALT